MEKMNWPNIYGMHENFHLERSLPRYICWVKATDVSCSSSWIIYYNEQAKENFVFLNYYINKYELWR